MSLFTLTFAQLKAEAEHAIGGSPDSRVTTAGLVNGALEYFCTVHPWTWRIVLTTLSTSQNVGEIDLPDDFGELVDLVGYGLRLTAIRKASPATVARVRVYGLQTSLSMVWYIGQKSQTTASATGARQLVVAPVPAATTANAFYLTYRKLIPQLSADSDVPNIPYGMFELLRWCVRGWAKLQTIGDGGADLMMFQRLLADYIAADALADGPRTGILADAVEMLDDLHPEGIFRLAPHTEIRVPGDP